MNRALYLIVVAAMVIGLAGCSDDDEIKQVTVHNTLDSLSRDRDFEFDLSHRGSALAAAHITVDDPIEVTQFIWSGVLDTFLAGPDGFNDGTADFEISIYNVQPIDVVSDTPIYQEVVSAVAEELSGNLVGVPNLQSFRPHQFTFQGASIVTLAGGEYWVVIANSRERSWFNWAVELGHVGVAVGSGGAIWEPSETSWQSPIPGTDPLVARGYSLRVVGNRL